MIGMNSSGNAIEASSSAYGTPIRENTTEKAVNVTSPSRNSALMNCSNKAWMSTSSLEHLT